VNCINNSLFFLYQQFYIAIAVAQPQTSKSLQPNDGVLNEELQKRFFAENWQRSASNSGYGGIPGFKTGGTLSDSSLCKPLFVSISKTAGSWALRPCSKLQPHGSEEESSESRKWLFYGQKGSTGTYWFGLF
jgi:hypothetical protein